MSKEFNPPKVQMVIYLGFDEESEEVLKLAWSVAEEVLENYGIWVEVIPVHIWVHDPMKLMIPDVPRIEINGQVMVVGRVPSKEELIDMVLSKVYSAGGETGEAYALASIQRNNKVFVDGVFSIV